MENDPMKKINETIEKIVQGMFKHEENIMVEYEYTDQEFIVTTIDLLMQELQKENMEWFNIICLCAVLRKCYLQNKKGRDITMQEWLVEVVAR